jgi:hypothetical protein
VNAQLIDAETGAHIWADRFEEDLADLFKLQDQVVARLANALNYELVRADAETAARSKNPDLIDLDMRGTEALWRFQQQPTKDGLMAIRALFEQALKIDPDDPEALGGDAATYLNEKAFGWANPETDYEAKVLAQADRAIALAPRTPWNYSTKSVWLTMTGRPKEGLRVAASSFGRKILITDSVAVAIDPAMGCGNGRSHRGCAKRRRAERRRAAVAVSIGAVAVPTVVAIATAVTVATWAASPGSAAMIDAAAGPHSGHAAMHHICFRDHALAQLRRWVGTLQFDGAGLRRAQT